MFHIMEQLLVAIYWVPIKAKEPQQLFNIHITSDPNLWNHYPRLIKITTFNFYLKIYKHMHI